MFVNDNEMPCSIFPQSLQCLTATKRMLILLSVLFCSWYIKSLSPFPDWSFKIFVNQILKCSFEQSSSMAPSTREYLLGLQSCCAPGRCSEQHRVDIFNSIILRYGVTNKCLNPVLKSLPWYFRFFEVNKLSWSLFVSYTTVYGMFYSNVHFVKPLCQYRHFWLLPK